MNEFLNGCLIVATWAVCFWFGRLMYQYTKARHIEKHGGGA